MLISKFIPSTPHFPQRSNSSRKSIVVWYLGVPAQNLPKYGFPKYGFSIIVWFHYMVSQSSYGSIIWFLNHRMVPLYGFSIIIWFHCMVSQSSYGSIIWFLNQKMVSQKMVFSKNLVNYMFPNQTSAFSRYPATDSSKCASTTDSICFRAIIECITSYDSSVWFKLIVYKVKYSICCFKTLRYLLLTIFVCLTIYLFFFLFFSWFFQMVYCLQISIGISLCCLWHLL